MAVPSFSSQLARPGIIVVPGVYDALSAKLATQAGAQALYMTGFGVTGSLLGAPDIGLLTATEMTERARAIADACAPLPLIADGDNGHGGVHNVARLTRLYQQAGVACIQLEDQVLPKRCGHMENKEIVPRKEAVARIRAAVDARQTTGLRIMARTDARATHGLEEAIARGQAFLDAGADILFIEAPQSLRELEKIATTFRDIPLVANMVEDGQSPCLGAAELEALGYKIVLFPVSALLSVCRHLTSFYDALLQNGQPCQHIPRLSFEDYNNRMGLPGFLSRADDYLKTGKE